eukprot:TRINITY_DN3032_c0_g1_i2.p1 TRINITY_DN3032_c0_g1~~TRINITY_DN3032_c0_g1_i2.p1  ORF type:complete len:184 (+),score=32.38 TRINITY_DN3032_c0_g1_i2:188-739(+)
MWRYTSDKFDPDSRTTVGVEFAVRSLTIDGKIIRAQVWDTAGQERYRSIINAYYRGAVGAMVVYDITRRSSFENAERWLQQLKEHAHPKTIVMLVGNKSDLSKTRTVTEEEAKKFAHDRSLLFREVSALDASYIDESFTIVLTEIYKKLYKKKIAIDPVEEKEIKTVKVEETVEPPKKRGCCG